ncbi:hypothetical protein PVAND_006528 [Polypedilum vanderplanki]|uniref:Peptidoglycan recognition protein family domain-containing protein n=1 Tax=Polypedilum vanderplanki TaxID=319348 RepID=A0A9J6C4G4_POLVA|nr:hypothetical protein PVAND_006528 [Polypedilum vanderplanki]
MEVTNNEIIERYQPFPTFENSEYFQQNGDIQNYEDITRNTALKIPVNNQKAIVAVSSEDIHVGNIIYYHVQNQMKMQNMKVEKTSEKIPENETSSSKMSSDFDNNSKLNKWFNRENNKRNILITTIALFGISLSALIIYIVILSDTSENNYTSTTSKIITDDDITTTIPLTTTTTTTLSESTSTTLISTTTIAYQDIPLPDFLISRDEWNANPTNSNISRLHFPIKRIIIAHTGGRYCFEEIDCKNLVKEIQNENSHLDDIPYNYLIGEDGKIYEGRGFEFQGEHTSNLYGTEFNSIGICIAFMGNYQSLSPILTPLIKFIDYYLSYKVIDEDYKLFSQDDLIIRDDKAYALKDAIKGMDNFYELRKIIRREEWNADIPRDEQIKFNRIMDMAMLAHTVTNRCFTINECAAIGQQIQNKSFEDGLIDFKYGFIIGNNGLVFEGRGWDVIGEHTPNYDSISVGIAVIGNYDNTEPYKSMYTTLADFLDDSYALGKLTDDYKLHGQIDFGGSGPGREFFNNILNWCRYGNRTTSSETPCISTR